MSEKVAQGSNPPNLHSTAEPGPPPTSTPEGDGGGSRPDAPADRSGHEPGQDGTRSPVHTRGETMAGLTSLSLLDRARGADPEAWQRLVALYTPLVEIWGHRDGLSGTEIEDAKQEVFLAVHQSLTRFERRKDGSFRSWLRSVTRSKVIDLQRRRGAERAEGGTDAGHRLGQLEAESPGSGDGSSESAEVRMLYQRAMELIQRDFSEATCKAFLQTTVDRRATADVAADLGMTANAVRLAKARVLQRLRADFVGLIED